MPYEPLSTQTGAGGQGGYVPLSASPVTPATPAAPTPTHSPVGTQTWNGQQVPADIGTKNLVSYDATTGNRQFKDPGSGGIYAEDANKNLIYGGHTNYGGVPPRAGSQRDDIIPAGLGGVNSNAQNIAYVPLSTAQEQDKVETNLSRQVKSGQIQPKAAIGEALSQKSVIANKPSFFQKVGTFFSDIGSNVRKIASDVVGGTVRDVKNSALNANDAITRSLAVRNDPKASNAQRASAAIDTAVSLANAAFVSIGTAVGITELFNIPAIRDTVGKGFAKAGDVGGKTLGAVVDAATSHLPISPADRTLIHDTAVKTGGLLTQIGIGEAVFHAPEIRDAMVKGAIDHLTTSVDFSRQIALDINAERPVDPQVLEAYKKLSDEQKSAVGNGVLTSVPGIDPNVLGKMLGLTREEAIAIRNAKGQAVVSTDQSTQGNQAKLGTSLVPQEPIATTIHPSSIVPQEPLVTDNFLQNIPELAKPVEAPGSLKSAPGEAIGQKAVDSLIESKSGEASIAHPELGKIDLPWGQKDIAGKGGFGLAHILEGEDGTKIAQNLSDIISESTVVEKGPTRAFLETPDHRSVVVLDWKGEPKQWVLTSYKKNVRGEGIEPSTSALSEQRSTTELPAGASDQNRTGVANSSDSRSATELPRQTKSSTLSPELQPLAQEARKYKSAEEFVKAQTARPNYGYGHSPNSDGVPAFDLTAKVDGEQMIPKDMYTQWYGSRGTPSDLESIAALKKIKGNPEAKVTIYRASPKNEWNYGDWTTLSKKYAESHAEGNTGFKVFSKVVQAKDLKWAMDDVNEFGYFPESTKSQLTDFYNQATKPNLPEVKAKKDSSVTLASGFNPGVDKFIAEEVKPGLEKTKEVASIISKTVSRIVEVIRGVLNADAPVRKNLGDTAYSDVIRAIHLPEAERITFDNNFNQTEKWFDQFTNEQLKNFNLSRGTPSTPEAKGLQQKAQASLPTELQSPEVTKSIKQASDYVFSLATDAGLDLAYFEDYFRGVYKDPGKVKDFLDYWRSTEGYTKNKVFPSIADASAFGLELKDPNPIRNIRSELEAVTKRVGLKQLRDKLESNPLSRTFSVKTEDATAIQKQEWSPIHDPVFKGMLFDPDYARLVDNLISTNKVSQNLFTKGLRQLNQLVMQVKFTGSLFHLGNELKASVAQEAFGVADPRGYVDFMKSFKPLDTTSPIYKDYVGLGGGHTYSLEAQAQNQLSVGMQKLLSGNYLGAGTRIAVGVAKIPVEVTRWMFEKFIPKLKFEKFSQDLVAGEEKLGRPLTDAEKINIIKRNQNFYGEMNERLFGRSGTATSAVRLFFQAPGYGEGNFRALGRGAPDFKGNWEDPKSARFVFHSLFATLVVALVGTRILTGKWPDVPKKMRDIRDLFKIKTNQKDGNGDTIYYDAMTYDKDYWSIIGNVLTGQLSNVGTDLTTRLAGSIGGLPKAMTDTAAILEGKIVVDWKGTPIYSATDTTPQKMQKYLNYEFGSLEPISVSGFQQSRQKGQSLLASATTAIAGVRVTTSEEVKHLKAIRADLFSLQDQKKQEQIRLNSLASTNEAEAQKEAHDFNATQMAKLKALFKEYPGSNVTKSLYFLSTLNPKGKTSGGTTSKSILGQ